MRLLKSPLFLLCLFSSSAMADWIEVGRHADGEYIAYIDPTSKLTTDNGVKVWKMREYMNPQQDEGMDHSYRSDKSLQEFDCSNRRMRELSLEDFAGPHATGSMLHSQSNPNPWQKIVPGSIGEASFSFVCTG